MSRLKQEKQLCKSDANPVALYLSVDSGIKNQYAVLPGYIIFDLTFRFCALLFSCVKGLRQLAICAKI